MPLFVFHFQYELGNAFLCSLVCYVYALLTSMVLSCSKCFFKEFVAFLSSYNSTICSLFQNLPRLGTRGENREHSLTENCHLSLNVGAVNCQLHPSTVLLSFQPTSPILFALTFCRPPRALSCVPRFPTSPIAVATFQALCPSFPPSSLLGREIIPKIVKKKY